MIPLVVHSNYSLMLGVDSPAAICRQAAKAGYSSLALTDLNNLYGLWAFLDACQAEGLTPIIGAEISAIEGAAETVVCLVENLVGYRNLCKIITSRNCRKDFSLKHSVASHQEGLIILSTNVELLAELKAGGLEVFAMLPGRPSRLSRQVRASAGKVGIKSVAVPDSFFGDQDGYKLYLLLQAISQNKLLSFVSPGERVSSSSWLASPEEYRQRFAVWPDVIEMTEVIAARCRFAGPDFGFVMPDYEQDGVTAAEVLRQKSFGGARGRYGQELSEVVVNRLNYELGIIEEKGFSPYFLLVRDIVTPGLRTCGRGSGAASLVAYCLNITDVCPIKFNLYFERFLNRGRNDPPDLDIDFAWDEREQVLTAVFARYKDRAAMVCNHVFFQKRMALRETAKAYGLSAFELKRLINKMEQIWQLAAGEPEGGKHCQPAEKGYASLPDPWLEVAQMAQRLVGIPRYISLHPGGVVITPGPVSDYVPVQMAAKGVPVIQWEKDGAERSGLVKIDILGNRSLAVVRDAIKEVRQNDDRVSFADWHPEDDHLTRQLVAGGKTMGCFYIESPAMRMLQKKAGRGDFEHLVIHSSIIRPAANEYIREYLRRLHGGKWQALHPLVEEVLADTYGIMSYQEDVARVAVILAGFSHAEADLLRKIMSKKEHRLKLADYKEKFIQGCLQKGVSEEKCRLVWKMMLSFSGYSFCKPHSASYAKVSFQAAYLKAHFPAEFMAAVISNGGGFYSAFAYVSEARRLGLEIRPPDVNISKVGWSGRGKILTVGLASLKNLGMKTMAAIVAERSTGQFLSVADFISRVKPDIDEAKMLLHAGALDSLGEDSRVSKLWLIIYHLKQQSGNMLIGAGNYLPTPVFPEISRLERLRQEFRALGFLCGQHPLLLVPAYGRESRCAVKSIDLQKMVGKRVRFAGWLITGKLVSTKSGDPMEFITFEDEHGLVESTFFPKIYQRYGHLLEMTRPYLLHGLVEEDYGVVSLTVERVERLA